jgi:hypothetical protein
MELKPSHYDAALKMLNSAQEALTQAMTSVKRRDESSILRRRIEEVEGFLKRVKRDLRLG